ncbi:MAG: SusC/RagA family TonB-linked outer membrane protein [Gemmatimonadaceae bacterium]
MNKRVRAGLTTLALALLPAGLLAQGGTVSGRVIDQATQQPLQDAQIQVVGTQRGASTDQQGRFTITGIPAGVVDLRARRIGYSVGAQQVTLGAGATATVNFTLASSATQLQEVVVNAVTGQVERRVEVGTNVGHVNVGELNKGPITSLGDVLQGRIAGVTLQSAGGTTGGGQRVRIRGANSISLSNEPLLYIDGIAASNSKGGITLGGQDYSRLNDINPEEIENIEILKGPAASAIYGSAASNGVILITTKRGRAGKAQWRGYAEAGEMEDRNTYPLNYASLTQFGAGDYYDIENGGILNIRSLFGSSAPYDICPNYRAAIPTGTTVKGQASCVQDVTLSFDQFRDARTTPYQTGTRNKFGLNVSGGADALTFFLSGDKEQEYGVLRPNNLDRISLRTNLNARVGQRATAAITAAYIRSDTKRISNDNSIFSPLINALLGTAQYLPGMESDTVRRASDRLGSYFGYNTNDQRKVQAFQDLDRFIIGANTNYTPLSWLKVNGNAGLDYFGRYDRQTVNPNELPLAQSYILGFRDAFRATSYIYTANGSGSATFQPLSAVVSTSTLGASFQRSLFENIECYGVGIPAGTTSCAASTSQFAVSEDHAESKTVGVFGRQELSFNDRLFLSASLRADNNSGLVRDVSGLSYYPSVNGSWVVSRENFFPKQDYINQFRIRAGWGQAGQRPGFGQGDTFFGSRVVQSGSQEIPALVLVSTGNPGLKVERTTEFEGGFDIGFLNDRLSTEFTAFTRKSVDALIAVNLPPSSGLSGSVFRNLGSVRNSGTELGVNANVISTDKFAFTAHLNSTTLKNSIENLGDSVAPIQFNRGSQAHRTDFPTGAFFATPIKYNDADGNGKLSRDEVTIDTTKFQVVRNRLLNKLDTLNQAYVGPSLPTNTQSLSGDLTLFKNLTFSALFERRAGAKQLNYTEYFRCRTTNANPYYSQCSALSNPNASLQSQAAYIGAQFLGATPYGYIEDADFIKFREFSARFGIPEMVAARFGALRGASVSLSGRNLKTWTDYTGLDPEINETGGSNFTQGEFNTQPPTRLWALRFDFKL